MTKKREKETSEQLAHRLEQILPYTWEVLQEIPFPESIWEKVNNNPYKVGPLVDRVEDAATDLSRLLRVTPKQALLILIETCYQRLD